MSIFAEVQSAYFVLRAWKKNPKATKQEIGVFHQWQEDEKANKKPLAKSEVERFKRFLQQHAPTSYYDLFRSEKGVGPKEAARSFYTAQELANRLQVNIMTIYRYIKAGKLGAYKIGKEFRIGKSEFEKFLKKVETKQLYDKTLRS